jgi:hypothetical protein
VSAMAYHVQIRRSLRRAWAFNLDRDRVSRAVIEPWLAGRTLRLGDREWLPRDCSLRIVEGPELPPQDLAFGQGWNAAERSGEDVTRGLLGEVANARASADGAEVAAIGDALSAALAAAAAGDPVLAPLRHRLLNDPQSLAGLAANLRGQLAARRISRAG